MSGEGGVETLEAKMKSLARGKVSACNYTFVSIATRHARGVRGGGCEDARAGSWRARMRSGSGGAERLRFGPGVSGLWSFGGASGWWLRVAGALSCEELQLWCGLSGDRIGPTRHGWAGCG